LNNFERFPALRLHESDYKEFDLAFSLNKRMSSLPRVVDKSIEGPRKRSRYLETIFKTLTRLLSSKIPHGSRSRRFAKNIVNLLPLYFRNLVLAALSPTFTSSGERKVQVNYSLDQGFGLPTSLSPLVSIILPVHNHWWVTYRCLRALQANTDKTPYEIILVDDSSTDQTPEALANIRGVSVIRNSTNIGYLLSTNLGASFAALESKYLVLLNNDTEPCDGWLDKLFENIEGDSSTAIVGSALIYPDGTLQEAGGQLFASGEGWNLGRGGNPSDDLFAFTREVDYCSAASIIVRRSFWLEVGGFDIRYVPAYCEDSDLALSAWSKGLKVKFEPKSWVIHHEGVSHGKSTSSGLKNYQIINNRKLFAKWEESFRKHWINQDIPRFEATRDSKGIVVICDRQLPCISRDAGSIRTVQIIQHIQALGYHVVLACLDNSTTEVDLETLRCMGVEIQLDLNAFYQTLSMRQNRVCAIWTIRDEVYDFFSARLKKIAPKAIFVADLMDIKYREAYIRESGISKNQLRIASEVNEIVLVSEVEVSEFNSTIHSQVANVLWAEYEPQPSEISWDDSSGLIFVGGFRHLPNLEGIEWFADNVVPHLLKMGFTAPIRVVGSGLSSEKTMELRNKGLQMLGGVESLGTYYLESRIAVIPLLSGAGRKGKVGEALSYGIPIVSTSVGVDGFGSLEESGVVVVDPAYEMAELICNLHEDPDLWNRVSALGKSYCRNHLSSKAMREQISRLIEPRLVSNEK